MKMLLIFRELQLFTIRFSCYCSCTWVRCNVLVESKHVKSSFLSGVLQSTFRGVKYCEMQGDINQQGGAFVLGPGQCIDACPVYSICTCMHCVSKIMPCSFRILNCDSKIYHTVFWYLYLLNTFHLNLVVTLCEKLFSQKHAFVRKEIKFR